MTILGKRKRVELAGSEKQQVASKHPFLTGNFAPIQKTCPLTPCTFLGDIPDELLGGQYVRNGSNPVSNEDLGRDAHWFDGDGMLSGVLFRRKLNPTDGTPSVQPEFVNQYILTDLFLSATTTENLRKPIAPSIATLVSPLASLIHLTFCVLRSVLLVLLSKLPGSRQSIKKISVANTSIMYHDGRALATCESGPPMRVSLPTLDTVGWFNGLCAEGEHQPESSEGGFGGKGLLSFMKEWTTAHPKVDPSTNDMILFHSTFAPPYVHYSVIPAAESEEGSRPQRGKLLNAPVPGIESAKMMHDFGVSSQHTVIMDLPLTLDPLMTLRNKAPVTYDPSKHSRFGIFPRHNTQLVKWFETSACCIFHTANTWDVYGENESIVNVDMLACRMTSASVVFSAGNIPVPEPAQPYTTAIDLSSNYQSRKRPGIRSTSYGNGPSMEAKMDETCPLLPKASQGNKESAPGQFYNEFEEHQCRLYYFSFDMTSTDKRDISYQFALSAIPFEFPSVRDDMNMSAARYVYGCSTSSGSFNPALGKTSKIDALVKIDVHTLIERGKMQCLKSVTGCVDTRSVNEILESPLESDPIQIFKTPANVCAQEPRFVPAANRSGEDSGYLLSYMFDESQLDSNGEAIPSAYSELWVIDAKSMSNVLAKVVLPYRVPYGLHGSWFSERDVLNQRPVASLRQRPVEQDRPKEPWYAKAARRASSQVVRAIGG